MPRIVLHFSALLLAAAISAGASTTAFSQSDPKASGSRLKKPLPQSNETGSVTGDGRYQLSADEQALDCRKLTGRMQVRLMQIRDNRPVETTQTARNMRGVAQSMFGGTTYGMDPAAERRRDLALLQAYNNRLAEKKCPTYNLEKELRAKQGDDLPRPVIPAKKRHG